MILIEVVIIFLKGGHCDGVPGEGEGLWAKVREGKSI